MRVSHINNHSHIFHFINYTTPKLAQTAPIGSWVRMGPSFHDVTNLIVMIMHHSNYADANLIKFINIIQFSLKRIASFD